MFSHVLIGARDLSRLGAFYDAVLQPLGLMREWDGGEDDGGPDEISWGRPGQRWLLFCVQLPWNGAPATAGPAGD